MNARVGSLNPWPADLFSGMYLNDTMSTTDNFVCDRSHLLLDFMLDNNFVLLNGRTKSDSSAQPTFDGNGISIIDLIWADIPSLHFIVDLEIILEHKPVCYQITDQSI